MTILERIMGLIAMIPHVENGECMEMGSIWDLGQAVGSNVGIRQGWQWHGHWCSHCCHLGVIRHILESSINVQMDVAIAVFVRCWEMAPNVGYMTAFVVVGWCRFTCFVGIACSAASHEGLCAGWRVKWGS
ncbi:uncharacterized protein EV420DRAFT_1484514 [Desarmillaria tabescens]|uniref:Uncharacterized protein n=1 Tax=Armillaria tabescens TaxID=1929756 RepID=A0AA39JLM8_ARMTA|nr:uncharacterized protein EV420DRAFT_1484514 [Desarmillaria tabescens]KAK0444923.1 hypothetical protein EV420DRAFT_1484514 [Desarmillaria tabescens]